MNTLDLLLFQNDGECDLLDDNFNINGSTRNQSIMIDENSFISSKATPLATFNSNDKVIINLFNICPNTNLITIGKTTRSSC